MSMQPNPSGQMDYNALLPILATFANRKGGGNAGDLGNITNPLMGLFSNSYTAPSQISQEEIVRTYAPQTLAIRNSDDPIAISVLDYIERGYPAIQIKKILSDGVYKTGDIELNDENELSMYNSLIDDLFAESKKVDEKLYEVANKQDIYEEYGLRNPNEEFDAQQLFPEVFSPMADRLNATQADVDRRLKEIDVAAGDPTVYASPEKQEGKTYLDKVRRKPVTELANLGLGRIPSAIGMLQTGMDLISTEGDGSLESQYQSDLNQVASSMGLSPQQIESGNTPQAKAARRALQIKRQDTLKEYEKKQKKEAPKVDARATSMNKAAIQYQKELAGAAAPQRMATTSVGQLKDPNTGKDVDMSRAVQGSVTKIPTENLRDPVLQQQKLIDLVQRKVQEGLRARGETPFNQDMLNRLILNKAMGG
jgi:hypothetical protein